MDGINNLPITSNDLISAVRESALLADVTVSMWNAERTDKEVGKKIKQDAGAIDASGRFVKNLLAGADSKLKEVRSAFQAVRNLHYAMTLPWVSDPHAVRQSGPRLLTHMLFNKYLTDVQKQRRVANDLLDEFVDLYPGLVEEAKQNLGTLAGVDYPAPDEIRRSFRVHFDFTPIPEGAQFRGLPTHTVERLSEALEDRQKRAIEQAQKAMWDAARERIQHIVDRLSDPDNSFRKGTIENVRELLTMLPGWNVSNDSRVAEIVQDIKSMLDGIDAQAIRDDTNIRAQVAKDAGNITKKLSGWGL